jgi:hypothetical protein
MKRRPCTELSSGVSKEIGPDIDQNPCPEAKKIVCSLKATLDLVAAVFTTPKMRKEGHVVSKIGKNRL